MDKNQQFLTFLTKEHPSASITVLMKLAYLIDLVSVKNTGKQISDFSYIRYNYGPFTNEIYRGVDALVMSHIVVPKSEYTGSGEYVTYAINPEIEVSFDNLSETELSTINDVMSELKGYGAKTLTEIAYKTKPMTNLGATLGGNENLFKSLDLTQA